MKRQFRGIWIPASIWLNGDMTIIEKCLYAEIHSFSASDSGCYKSNKTLSEQFCVSESTIKRAVKNLELQGFICLHRTGRTRSMTVLDLECMGHSEPLDGQYDLHEGQIESDKGQNDPPVGSDCTPSKTVSRTASSTNSSTIEKEIVLPFDTDAFKHWWDTWLQERRDRRYKKYTHKGEQAALHKLINDAYGDEAVAIAMIQQSIAHGWRGLFPVKQNRNGKGASQSFDTGKLQSYLESLGDD